MTRTSTTIKSAESDAQNSLEKRQLLANMDDDLFYENLKPQLDGLLKSPADEVVDRILAYSRATKK